MPRNHPVASFMFFICPSSATLEAITPACVRGHCKDMLLKFSFRELHLRLGVLVLVELIGWERKRTECRKDKSKYEEARRQRRKETGFLWRQADVSGQDGKCALG